MQRYYYHCNHHHHVPYSTKIIRPVIITFLLVLLLLSFNIETLIITSTVPLLHVVTAFTVVPNSLLVSISIPTTIRQRQQQQQQNRLLFGQQQQHVVPRRRSSCWVKTVPILSHQNRIITLSALSNSATTELDTTTTTTSTTTNNNDNNNISNKYLSANQQEIKKNIPYNQYPRTWVPMGSIYELDPLRPTEVEFLGISYVIYRGSYTTTGTSTSTSSNIQEETWIVADNTCPHRLAPLSEGRIITKVDTTTSTEQIQITTNSLLQCSYHGWTFNNNGTCVSIPQASNTIVESNAFKNKLCHVPIYPTMIHKDIVWAWIWPESITEITSQIILQNNLTSASTSTSTIDNKSNNEYNNNIIEQLVGNPYWMLQRVPDTNITTYTRELPYGWDTLLENIVDPSHVPFAHHGLQGTRNDATAITMSIDKFQKFITNTMYGTGSTSDTSDATAMSVTIAGDNNNNNNSEDTGLPTTKQEHKQQQEQRLFQTGFDYNFIDRTMTMKRNCTGVFRAPYLIQYEGEYYANDTDRTFNLSVLMIPTKPGWSRVTIFGSTVFGKSDNDDDDEEEADTLLSTDSTVLSINTTVTDTNHFDDNAVHNKVMIKDHNNKKTTTIKKKQRKEKKKNKFSIFSILMRILPIWVIHQFSNRFLDSDLAFLHYQEQERRRRKRISYNYNSSDDDEGSTTTSSTTTTDTGVQVDTTDTTTNTKSSNSNNSKLLYDIRNYYFVPAQADRGITTIRRWVRQYANYIIDVEQDIVPERIYDRSILFNRYIQHTDKCKYCSKAYHTTIPLYKKYCYRTLYTSIVLLCTILGNNTGSKLLLPTRIALSLVTIGSIFTLRLLSIAEQLLTKGYDFKHYEND